MFEPHISSVRRVWQARWVKRDGLKSVALHTLLLTFLLPSGPPSMVIDGQTY
jgi:hypothetical protein